MAWLEAVPEGQNEKRLSWIDDPFYPEVEYGLHLVDYMQKIADKTSYPEIESWSNLTKTPLSGWEAETMVLIGSRYESMKQKAVKNDVPEPYVMNSDGELDDNVIDRLRKKEDAMWDQMRLMDWSSD